MRTRHFGEWQFLADDGAQRAVFEACKEPGVDVRLFLRCNAPERNARIEARRPISSRGLMVTSPRLPITMMRPLLAKSFVSWESSHSRASPE